MKGLEKTYVEDLLNINFNGYGKDFTGEEKNPE